MKAFLYHVLNSLIIDEYRKRKRQTSSLDAMIEKGFEPGAETSGNPTDALDGKLLVLLIGHLPEKYKKVMRMRYIQELTLKEMALLTGQTKATVAVQVHRGLAKLKLLYNRA